MAFGIRYSMDVVWIGDGVNAMSVPSAQRKKFVQTTIVQVPGGDAPSQANFNTAIGTTMAADLELQVAGNLTQILAFATGGG